MRRILLLLLVVTAAAPARSARFGEVVQIADGDTLTVRLDGRRVKVRLAGIDAPGLNRAGGTRARKALAALAFGQRVRIEPRPATAGREAAGSVLFAAGEVTVARPPPPARVFAGNLDLGAEMVRRGYARVIRTGRPDPALIALEGEARAARRGLWASGGQIPSSKPRAASPAPSPPVPASPVPAPSAPAPPKVYCTQEVKQCPDGSWVARHPPGCAFARCPGAGERARDSTGRR